MQQVVTLQSTYAAMSNQLLSRLLVLQPNTNTQELVVASTSSETTSETSSMMSSVGESGVSTMAKSSSISASASGGGGQGSIGSSSASGDSGSSSSASGSGSSSGSETTSHQYFMSKYFIQPQAVISVSPLMVQPTAAFEEALQLVKKGKSGYSVSNLFSEFGTHVCLSAQLGGWWKITATFTSESARSTTEMAVATTAAIGSVVSSSRSMSASAGYSQPGTGGGSAGYSHSKSSGSSSSSAAGDAQQVAQTEGDSQTNLQVTEEWKGGIGNLPMSSWLDSLTPAQNSNWKVIDRRMPECIGVWQFAADPLLRRDICTQYLVTYLIQMNAVAWDGSDKMSVSSMKGPIQSICSDAADIKTLQSRINQMVANSIKEKTESQISTCDALDGSHWYEGSCIENQCVCGSDPGATGTACPINGAQVCLTSQQATCSQSACTAGYWYNSAVAGSSTCSSQTCSPSTTDNSLCCQPISQSNAFSVVLQIGSNGGSCSSLSVTISGPGSEQTIKNDLSATTFKSMSQSTLTVSNQDVAAFTPTTIEISMSGCTVTLNNEGTPAAVTIYNGAMGAASTSTVVGCTYNSWSEFSGNQRTQSSSISPCN
mmetsp:Transcript_13375/g.43289  ORF Transcript_13375/g.43289 Transcript_13375/m.43289 type:complete len:599 (-) Transcript_13375:143-1939(-)